MKKLILVMMAFSFVAFSNAQSEKYTKAMEKNLTLLDSSFSNPQLFAEVVNNFERIGTAEKTQWLPFYYAAYASVMQVMRSEDKSNADAGADKAEELITKAEQALGKENSETCVIKSLIATAHMMVDPMSRWMKYGKPSAENIAKAKVLDPTNPRPYFLDGQAKLFTPESFGGGKEVAKPILEKAVALYAAFKPETVLHPTWGAGPAKEALAQTN